MTNESRESKIQLAVSRLSARELYAYQIWCGTEKAPLAPSLNAKLFNLFLNGKSCEEIRRMNPALGLGDIVAASIEGDWHRRRDEHLDELLTQTSMRVQQTTLETADFVCDLLAVANREHGDRLRRYLQSGNEAELGDFRISSLPALKMAIETLQKLTGQERKSESRINVIGEVLHRQDPNQPRLPTAAEAGAALKLILGKTSQEN